MKKGDNIIHLEQRLVDLVLFGLFLLYSQFLLLLFRQAIKEFANAPAREVPRLWDELLVDDQVVFLLISVELELQKLMVLFQPLLVHFIRTVHA